MKERESNSVRARDDSKWRARGSKGRALRREKGLPDLPLDWNHIIREQRLQRFLRMLPNYLPTPLLQQNGVKITLEPKSASYQIGQQITIKAQAQVEGYLLLLYRDASGEVALIYPNRNALLRAQAANQTFTNLLHAGNVLTLPGELSHPTGKAVVRAILTRQPVGDFERLFDVHFSTPTLGRQPIRTKGLAAEIGARGTQADEEQIQWWEESCEFEVIDDPSC